MAVGPALRWALGLGLALLLVLALALAWIDSPSLRSLALSCLMYVTLASAWAMFSGPTRYLSLATSAFFGIGAYASVLVLDSLPWPLVVATGAASAALLATLIGALTLHLRGTYFAVLTFGITELTRHVVTYVEKQFSGTVGRVIVTAPDDTTLYLTMLTLAVLVIGVGAWLRRSRFGLALAGIGADELRAATLGVPTRSVKLGGFALSAAFAGAVGAAMAVRWTYIDPAAVFNPFIGFQTVVIAMVGGAASLAGPVVAAILFSLLTEFLRVQLPYAYLVVLGVLLIVSVIWLPDGIAALRPRRARAAAPADKDDA